MIIRGGPAAYSATIAALSAVLFTAAPVSDADAERELIDDVVRKVRRAAAREHELMMLARIPRHEHDLATTARELAAIAYREAEKAGVEIDHFRHVGDEHTDVAQSQSV